MRKSLVAAQIQPDAAEETDRIGDPVAAALEHFDLVVQSFNPTARGATGEVVGNDLHIFFQRGDELVEAIQTAAFDFVDPTLNRKKIWAPAICQGG